VGESDSTAPRTRVRPTRTPFATCPLVTFTRAGKGRTGEEISIRDSRKRLDAALELAAQRLDAAGSSMERRVRTTDNPAPNEVVPAALTQNNGASSHKPKGHRAQSPVALHVPAFSSSSRGGTRTPNSRIMIPLLYRLSYPADNRKS
jgi:hypothetical protein